MMKSVSSNSFLYLFAIGFNRLIPAWIFRCRLFNVYELTSAKAENKSLRANTEKSTNPPSTAVDWCETEDDYRLVEELTYFRRAYSSGAHAACSAKIKGKLAGGFWAATEQFDESELNLSIRLELQQTWLFAALVSKEFRRLGIHSQMLRFMISELPARGLHEMFVSVNPANKGSLRVHEKYAACKTGSVFAMRFLRFAFCFSLGNIKCIRWYSFNSHRLPLEIQCRGRFHKESLNADR